MFLDYITNMTIMPSNELIDFKSLNLDLKNFRTVPQNSEEDAINAMISIKPERFHAIMESIIDDGYLLTENLIVIRNGSHLIVREGNRRVAALKLIHGIYDLGNFGIPDSIISKVKNLDSEWRDNNLHIPCSIFNDHESEKVDKIVNLAHAKGEKASRDPWTAVARARHNRDQKKASEPALDLLEVYIKQGKNITVQQKERWSGDYNITVLDEAIRKIIIRLGYKSIPDLVKDYPHNKLRPNIERIMLDIGSNILQFKHIRDTHIDFALVYDIPQFNKDPDETEPKVGSSEGQSAKSYSDSSKAKSDASSQDSSSSTTNPSDDVTTPENGKPHSDIFKAAAIGDPRYVSLMLKKFNPKGNDRQKIVTLRDELRSLKIKSNPIAFCFIIRSMFEISAKVYCTENSISVKKANGNDKSLVEQLREITSHLTKDKSNKELLKVLHGALTEMEKPVGILSVTSLNQLVHSQTFSVIPKDICTSFGNIYPLLEAMN